MVNRKNKIENTIGDNKGYAMFKFLIVSIFNWIKFIMIASVGLSFVWLKFIRLDNPNIAKIIVMKIKFFFTKIPLKKIDAKKDSKLYNKRFKVFFIQRLYFKTIFEQD